MLNYINAFLIIEKVTRVGEEFVASAERGERETEQNTPRVVYSKVTN